MSSLKPASALEKIADNAVTEGAMTLAGGMPALLIGVATSNPLATLLPVLSNSLASNRHKKRVEAALTEIDVILNEHAEAIQNLSDSQYKLINETVLTLLHTTNAEKIEYLKKAIRNSLGQEDVKPQVSVLLSRLLRDISTEEAYFMVKNFGYERIVLGAGGKDLDEKMYLVDLDSDESLVVRGLITLGLLVAGSPSFGSTNRYAFTPIAGKLVTLLR